MQHAHAVHAVFTAVQGNATVLNCSHPFPLLFWDLCDLSTNSSEGTGLVPNWTPMAIKAGKSSSFHAAEYHCSNSLAVQLFIAATKYSGTVFPTKYPH